MVGPTVRLNVTGVKEVRAKLRRVSEYVQNGEAIATALEAAAVPVVASAKARAPGKIGAAIRILWVMVNRTYGASVRIGVPKKSRRFEALFVERGTKERFRKFRQSGTDKKGRKRAVLRFDNGKASTGRMLATPFLGPALRQEEDTVRRIFRETFFRELIVKVLRK